MEAGDVLSQHSSCRPREQPFLPSRDAHSTNCPLLAHKPLRISSTFPSSPSPLLKFISPPHTTNLAQLRNQFRNPKSLRCEPITRRIFLQTGGTRLRNPSTAATRTSSSCQWVQHHLPAAPHGALGVQGETKVHGQQSVGELLQTPKRTTGLGTRPEPPAAPEGALQAGTSPQPGSKGLSPRITLPQRVCLLSPGAPDEFSCRPVRSLCCPTSGHRSSLPSCPAGTNVSMPGAATGATAVASPKVTNPTRTLL